MTVLITGGTGKTGQKLAGYLSSSNISYIIASRNPAADTTSSTSVNFDFTDPSTYANPFKHASSVSEEITSVYLIAPLATADPAGVTNAFVSYAVEKHGVKRFVLLTGTNVEKGGPGIGALWQHLADLKVEFTVLMATWFMENFSSWIHFHSIKNEGRIYSACEDGKAAFVSVDDISRVAFHALTSPTPLPETITLRGPELLTVDQAASTLSSVIGRPVTHVRLSPADRTSFLAKTPMGEKGAAFLTWLETETASGGEDVIDANVEKFTSIKAKKLEDWAQENKHAWN